jgi:hypothetical protein
MGRDYSKYGGEKRCIEEFSGENLDKLRRHKHKWEDNIKMYLQEVEWEA